LNLETSPIFFASAPLGWFERVMVWGLTVVGSWGISCTIVSSLIVNAEAWLSSYLGEKVAECVVLIHRQAEHAIGGA
jgi:hypothetical protein